MIDYYFILGLQSGTAASSDEIKAAYRRAALLHHPDRGGEHKRMKAVNEAYEVLSDPGRRAEYDQDLARAWAAAEERARPHSQAQSARPRQDAQRAPGGQREREYGPLYRQWQAHEDQVRRARRRTTTPLSAGFTGALVCTLIVAALGWLWLGHDCLRDGALGGLLFLLLSGPYWIAAIWVAVTVATGWEEVARWLTSKCSPT